MSSFPLWKLEPKSLSEMTVLRLQKGGALRVDPVDEQIEPDTHYAREITRNYRDGEQWNVTAGCPCDACQHYDRCAVTGDTCKRFVAYTNRGFGTKKSVKVGKNHD